MGESGVVCIPSALRPRPGPRVPVRSHDHPARVTSWSLDDRRSFWLKVKISRGFGLVVDALDTEGAAPGGHGTLDRVTFARPQHAIAKRHSHRHFVLHGVRLLRVAQRATELLVEVYVAEANE